jgi:hypothetical protein
MYYYVVPIEAANDYIIPLPFCCQHSQCMAERNSSGGVPHSQHGLAPQLSEDFKIIRLSFSIISDKESNNIHLNTMIDLLTISE